MAYNAIIIDLYNKKNNFGYYQNRGSQPAVQLLLIKLRSGPEVSPRIDKKRFLWG
jgi:hypothetical protein